MKIGAATMESSMKILQEIKIELPYDSLLDMYMKKPKTIIQKNICFLMFIAALFTIAKIWNQTKCPSLDKWIKQLWKIYIMNTTQL